MNNKRNLYLPPFLKDAGMVELVDTLDLGSSAERRGGSSPSARTISELTILITAHGHN